MPMSGRSSHAVQGGTANGSTTVGNISYPTDLVVSNRIGNTPNDYKAANSIEFVGEYVDNGSDEYVAYIVDGTHPDPNPASGGGTISVDAYRYGFNNKENDKDISEGGQDYGMRIYDSRLGKFLSVDPLTKSYPWNSTYAFAENDVLRCVDLDGLEKYYAADGKFLGQNGSSTEIRILKKDYINKLNNYVTIHNWISDKTKGLVKPINLGGLIKSNLLSTDLMSNSLETYKSTDDAAVSFTLQYASIAICEEIEFGARIGSVNLNNDQNNAVYVLGGTVSGVKDVNLETSDLYDTKLAAGTHIHGASARMKGFAGFTYNNFSGSGVDDLLHGKGDLDWSLEEKVPLYLANAKGELKVCYPKKYTSGDEIGTILRTDMPYSIYESSGDKKNNRPAFDKKIPYDEHRKPNGSDAIKYSQNGQKVGN